jgi:endonuclease IV
MDFSVNFLKQEIRRCEKLGINKLVLHPGSHVGQGVEVGLNNIIEGLNRTLEEDMLGSWQQGLSLPKEHLSGCSGDSTALPLPRLRPL